jgi:hypothetical protein
MTEGWKDRGSLGMLGMQLDRASFRGETPQGRLFEKMSLSGTKGHLNTCIRTLSYVLEEVHVRERCLKCTSVPV